MGCMRSARLERLLQRGSQRTRRADLPLTSASLSLDSAGGEQASALGSAQLPNGAANTVLAAFGQAGSAAEQEELQPMGSAHPLQGIACARLHYASAVLRSGRAPHASSCVQHGCVPCLLSVSE